MEELLSLKWNNHRSTFLHILSILRDKQLYTDATLACEGRFYNVHRLVLSTCSDYFSAMFDRTSCKNPIIVLKDIKCQDLEALLDYMYLGEVNVKQADLASLIKAAECLRVKGLAVPDDEPPRKGGRSDSSKIRNPDSVHSPPSKRKRREVSEDSRDDARTTSSVPKASHIQSRLSPLPRESKKESGQIASLSQMQSSNSLTNNISEPNMNCDETPFVKVEVEDSGGGDDIGDGGDLSYNLSNDSFKEESDGDPGGDMDKDLPEFLEQASGSNFSQPFGSGPSYQSDMQNWQGDQALSGNYSGLGYGPNQPQDGSQNTSGKNMENNSTTTDHGIPSSLSLTSQESMATSFSSLLASFQSGSSMHHRNWQERRKASTTTFTCDICSKSFLSGWELRRHLHAHSDSRPFKCSYCSHRANFKHNLKSHIQMVHRGLPFRYLIDTTPHKQ